MQNWQAAAGMSDLLGFPVWIGNSRFKDDQIAIERIGFSGVSGKHNPILPTIRIFYQSGRAGRRERRTEEIETLAKGYRAVCALVGVFTGIDLAFFGERIARRLALLQARTTIWKVIEIGSRCIVGNSGVRHWRRIVIAVRAQLKTRPLSGSVPPLMKQDILRELRIAALFNQLAHDVRKLDGFCGVDVRDKNRKIAIHLQTGLVGAVIQFSQSLK